MASNSNSNKENRKPFVVLRVSDQAEVADFALFSEAVALKDLLRNVVKDDNFIVVKQ